MENEDILEEYKNLLIDFDKALIENKNNINSFNEELEKHKTKLSNYCTLTMANTGLIEGIINDISDLSNNIGEKYGVVREKIKIIISHINCDSILINRK